MNPTTPQSTHATPESFWAGLQELNKKFAETRRLMQKDRAEMKERNLRFDMEMQKTWDQIKDTTEKQIKETEKRFKDTEKQIKETCRMVGGISNSNGKVAETYFTNSFTNHTYFAGQNYDSLDSNLSRKSKKLNLHGEFDLVMYNYTSVVIIEIKYKADKDDIEPLLKKPQIFKQLFPQYANFSIYLGLAGLSMEKDAEAEAKKQGIAVIKQIGKNMVIYDTYLKTF